MDKKIVAPVAAVAVVAIAAAVFMNQRQSPADIADKASPAGSVGTPKTEDLSADTGSGNANGSGAAAAAKPSANAYGISEALNEVASGKKKASEIQVADLPITSVGDLAGNSATLLKLRDEGSDIPEKILTQKTYDLSALGLDPRVVLEGYVYDTYKKRGEYDPVRLSSMPLGSDAYLQLVLKEIYTNHPEDFAKFGDLLIKRQNSESSRRFNIIVKMLEYGKSGGKFDITDPTYVLNNHANFFLKWSGWNDLTQDERAVLFEGKRIFDRYATMKQEDFKKNIDKEISELEAYWAKYQKAGLDKFFPETYYLPYMVGNLYAIKGDHEKGIAFATKEIEAATLTPRKEQSPLFNKDFNAIRARIGFLHYRKGLDLEAQGKKAEAKAAFAEAEKLMHSDLLVMPFTTPDVFVVWIDLKKKIENLK